MPKINSWQQYANDAQVKVRTTNVSCCLLLQFFEALFFLFFYSLYFMRDNGRIIVSRSSEKEMGVDREVHVNQLTKIASLRVCLASVRIRVQQGIYSEEFLQMYACLLVLHQNLNKSNLSLLEFRLQSVQIVRVPTRRLPLWAR